MRTCRLAALALATLGAPAGAAEGEWRWRLFGDGDNATLVYTHTDEGTDNFDSPRFTCKRASGKIRVEHVMRTAERKAFAAAIIDGKELKIDLAPPSRARCSRSRCTPPSTAGSTATRSRRTTPHSTA
jgi:hypothetical protein